jgi:hypothetical protein
MKRLPRGSVACAVTIVCAAVVHALATRLLVERDLLFAVTTRFDVVTVLAGVAALTTRLFLFLLAPGWVLYVVATHFLATRAAAAVAAGGERQVVPPEPPAPPEPVEPPEPPAPPAPPAPRRGT